MRYREITANPPQKIENSERMSSIDTFLSEEDVSSINYEIQGLNPDVIDEAMNEDDLIGTELVSRAMSHRSATDKDEEDIAPETEAYAPTSAFHGDHCTLSTNGYEDDDTTTVNGGGSTPTRRRSTIAETIKKTSTFQKISKFSWWDSDLKRERIKVYTEFATNYFLLSLILVILLSVYWGTYYKRESRFKNLKYLVVNDDLSVNGITPIIGNAVNFTAHLPSVRVYGNWIVYNLTEFNEIASSHNNTVYEEIKRQIHLQNYWGAIYVKPNITSSLYDAILNNNTDFQVTENLVDTIYETGRDLITMNSYVNKFLKVFESSFLEVVKNNYSTLVNELPTDDAKITSLSFLSQPFNFYFNDLVPVNSSIYQAPLTLGLTFLIVFAFFSFITTVKIHIYISTLVTGLRYIALRLVISHISYLILSLGYLLVNIAFGLDTAATFGKSGALVLWAIAFLTMASLGGLNEIVTLLLFTYYPKLIGGWLVLLMGFNIAPTVSSLALCSPFYRYGYAMPVHNSSEAAKVVFFDIYKGNLGRNLGILVAWDILSILLLPFVLIHVGKVKARRDAAQKLLPDKQN